MSMFKRKVQPLPVAKIGDPVLRRQARELTPEEIGSDATRDLVDAMIATMREEEGIGIAAPQVSQSIRLAVIEIPTDSTRYKDSDPFEMEVFINPKVTVIDEAEHTYWEGCLSVPDLRARVPRPSGVRVDYVGLDGEPRSITAGGFMATVLQHELDHLDGVLYLDRVRDTTTISTVDEYEKHWMKDDGEAAEG